MNSIQFLFKLLKLIYLSLWDPNFFLCLLTIMTAFTLPQKTKINTKP